MPVPFQILFGSTLGQVLRSGNKSWLLKDYKARVQIAVEQRLLDNRTGSHQEPTPFCP